MAQGFTLEQLQAMQNQSPTVGLTLDQLRAKATPQPVNHMDGFSVMDYFGRIGNAYQQAAQDVVTAITRPAQSAANGANPFEVAKQIGEAGLRTAGSVAGAALAPLTEAVAPIASPIVQKIASLPGISGGIKAVSDWAITHPEAAKDLEAVVNIASLGLGAKPAIEGSATVAGKATETAGKVLKGAGERAYRVVAPMEQSTAKALQSYQAAKPTLIERVSGLLSNESKTTTLTPPIRESASAARAGLAGTEWKLGVQAKKASTDLWEKTIKPSLATDKTPIYMPEFFNAVEKRIIAETPELSRRDALLNALSAIKDDYTHVNNVSLTKLQDYKAGWAKLVPERTYKGKPIAGALNEVRNMAAQEARARIYNSLGDPIKQAYLDYGNLQSIVESGLKSIDPLRSKSAYRQAWEFILDKALTPVASYGGKVLYKTGQGLEFVGKEGATKVKDLLRQ